jgi:hypothetical protein
VIFSCGFVSVEGADDRVEAIVEGFEERGDIDWWGCLVGCVVRRVGWFTLG